MKRSDMEQSFKRNPKRILIASSHPLFSKGLRKLLEEQWQEGVDVVGIVTSIDEAMVELDRLRPDVIIVDYDDENLNRDEFLTRFVGGEGKLRVVLLSLQEGGETVVYDRRSSTASNIVDWLEGMDIEDDFIEERNNDRKSSPRRENMKHFVFVAVIVAVLTAVVGFGLHQIGLLPTQSSLQATFIDRLFNLHVWVISFLFSLIVGFILYSVVVFRRRPGETGDGDYFEGNTRLEIIWTAAPLATVLFFAFLGSRSLAETRRADPNAINVRVVASQWSWRFEYTDYGFSSTELVLPVSQQTLLELTSMDVIHSFWVPEFRVKQDALPGENMERELRITPSEVGEFKVRCAELCGLQHAYMNAPVRILEVEDYEAWLDSQIAAPVGDASERGQQWAQQFGCVACHSSDGSQSAGPTWLGLFGSESLMEDGTTVTVNAQYIRESILDPSAKIVEGYLNIMPPNFADQMNDDQIEDVIAFIESLQQ